MQSGILPREPGETVVRRSRGEALQTVNSELRPAANSSPIFFSSQVISLSLDVLTCKMGITAALLSCPLERAECRFCRCFLCASGEPHGR